MAASRPDFGADFASGSGQNHLEIAFIDEDNLNHMIVVEHQDSEDDFGDDLESHSSSGESEELSEEDSVALFEELQVRKTLACGTVRSNRLGLPKNICNPKVLQVKTLKRGESLYRQKGKLTCVTWRDRKIVTTLATIPTDDTDIHIIERWTRFRAMARFPGEEAGVDSSLDSLALVVPDNEYNRRVPLVVGTNIAKQFQQRCQTVGGKRFLQTLRTSSAWRRVYQDMRDTERLNRTHDAGLKVHCVSRHAITVNAQESVVLKCLVHKIPSCHTKDVLLETTGQGGLAVTPGLITLSTDRTSCKIPVEITNNSNQPVTLQAKALIAYAHVAKVVPRPTVESPESEQTSHHLREFFNLDDTTLNADEKTKTHALLSKMSYVFAKDDKDLGCTAAVRHEILLTDNVPTREPYRRVPPGQLQEFREALMALLDSDVIRESKSPYASPVVLVRKRDGSLRICVDYRKINAKTVRDSYPLPRIQDIGSPTWCPLVLFA
ncbi:hypothetical protein QZH41_007622 [Actinostola sp. cb2023]|nr:hypothetical protein QZH41_007622 [Actinostola sp. cb2023]